MIRKFKEYFYIKKVITLEILETLCTICKYLDRQSRMTRQFDINPLFKNHFEELKYYSSYIKDDLKDEEFDLNEE